MKKISLLILLATTSSVLVAEKSELEILREKHDAALKEVVKHIDDMWYEEATVNSHTVNPQIGFVSGPMGITDGHYGASFGTTHTSTTINKLFFNTPEAGREYNKYLKALSPFEWDIFKKDLITSIATGIVSGLALNQKLLDQKTEAEWSTVDKIAVTAPFLAPIAEIIATNLLENPMKYFNSRTLSVHDNLYGNLSWKTTGRILGHVIMSYVTLGGTAIVKKAVLAK